MAFPAGPPTSPIYQPLDVNGFEIRMLTILPGRPESVVRCSLETTYLINPAKYAALSYCWGDADNTTCIVVNDAECSVTVNLADALRHLRGINVTRVWADALSINQTDEAEKSHQIRLMKHIYSRAEETYAWLGNEDASRSAAAIYFLQLILLEQTHLVDVTHSHPPRLTDQLPIPEDVDSPEQQDPPKRCQRCQIEDNFTSLVDLFRQMYWKRRWIIQEVAASSSVQVMIGSSRITLEGMTTALSKCRASCYWLSEFDSTYFHLGQVLLFRKLYQDDQKPLLCEMVRNTQRSLSVDVRDSIFALVGICKDGALLIPDDLGYQYPVEVAVMHITKAIIRETGCLDLIVINGNQGNALIQGPLPSWTPNWLSPSVPAEAYQLVEKTPCSEPGVPEVLPIDSRILRARGFVLGTILDITAPPRCVLTSPFQDDQETASGDCVPLATLKPAPYYSSNHEIRKALAACIESSKTLSATDESSRIIPRERSWSLTCVALGARWYPVQHIQTWVNNHAMFPIGSNSLSCSWIECTSHHLLKAILSSKTLTVMLMIVFALAYLAGFYSPALWLNRLAEHRQSALIPIASFFLSETTWLIIFAILAAKILKPWAGKAASGQQAVKNFEEGVSKFASSSTRLFVSEKGFLGTTITTARIGDKVCFLDRCSSIVLLREVNDSSEGRQYQVVGKAEVQLSTEDQYTYREIQLPYSDSGSSIEMTRIMRLREDELAKQDFDLV